jgi:cytochrome bd ubiquinol oxidase subunit II
MATRCGSSWPAPACSRPSRKVLAWLLIVAAAWSVRDGHTGWGFAATTAAIAATLASFWIALYPNVMVSKTNSAYNLTVANSAAGHCALVVMTVVAAVFAPLVIAYQAWSYHVFRGRITGPPVPIPADAPQVPTSPPG